MSDDLNADDRTFAPARCWGLKLASGGVRWSSTFEYHAPSLPGNRSS
jgi:hypothetical protein